MDLWPTLYTFLIHAGFHNEPGFACYNILACHNFTLWPAFYFMACILLYGMQNDHPHLHTQNQLHLISRSLITI